MPRAGDSGRGRAKPRVSISVVEARCYWGRPATQRRIAACPGCRMTSTLLQDPSAARRAAGYRAPAGTAPITVVLSVRDRPLEESALLFLRAPIPRVGNTNATRPVVVASSRTVDAGNVGHSLLPKVHRQPGSTSFPSSRPLHPSALTSYRRLRGIQRVARWQLIASYRRVHGVPATAYGPSRVVLVTRELAVPRDDHVSQGYPV